VNVNKGYTNNEPLVVKINKYYTKIYIKMIILFMK
jgi:hypothetical protein